MVITSKGESQILCNKDFSMKKSRLLPNFAELCSFNRKTEVNSFLLIIGHSGGFARNCPTNLETEALVLSLCYICGVNPTFCKESWLVFGFSEWRPLDLDVGLNLLEINNIPTELARCDSSKE